MNHRQELLRGLLVEVSVPQYRCIKGFSRVQDGRLLVHMRTPHLGVLLGSAGAETSMLH